MYYDYTKKASVTGIPELLKPENKKIAIGASLTKLTAGDFLDGDINSIRVYNKALNSDEIRYIVDVDEKRFI